MLVLVWAVNVFMMTFEVDFSLKALVTADGDATEGLVVDVFTLVSDAGNGKDSLGITIIGNIYKEEKRKKRKVPSVRSEMNF